MAHGRTAEGGGTRDLAVRVVCRPELGVGFSLAGLPVILADTAGEGIRLIQELAARPDIGVVLVESDMFDVLDEDTRRDLTQRVLPMVLPFPSPRWDRRVTGAEEYVVELLRQAIGYRVRLR